MKAVEPALMFFDGAIDAHPGEWILMDILKDGPDGYWSATGRILGHDKNRARMQKLALKLIQERNQGIATFRMLDLFEGVHLLASGDEVRRALDEALEKGLPIGWKPA